MVIVTALLVQRLLFKQVPQGFLVLIQKAGPLQLSLGMLRRADLLYSQVERDLVYSEDLCESLVAILTVHPKEVLYLSKPGSP